jgi:flagellar protein FliO/FliZ
MNTFFSRFRRRALAAAVILACLAPAGLAAQSAKEDVIYPRSAAAGASAPATPKPAASASSTWLLLAAAAAGVGGWLVWRQRRSPQGSLGREARKLTVAETRSLGNRQYLVVADYDGRKFLLGVCPGRIDLLSSLDGSSPNSQS